MSWCILVYIPVITTVIIAEMAVLNVARYLIGERRGWLPHRRGWLPHRGKARVACNYTASPRGQYSKSIQNFERKADSDENTVPVAWLD